MDEHHLCGGHQSQEVEVVVSVMQEEGLPLPHLSPWNAGDLDRGESRDGRCEASSKAGAERSGPGLGAGVEEGEEVDGGAGER